MRRLARDDHFLHARLATRLGSLDVYDDSQAEDQIKVACLSRSGTELYFDVWMAFPGLEARRRGQSRVIDPASSAEAVPVEAFRIDTTLAPPEMLEATAELDVEVRNGGQKLLIFELSRWLQVSAVSVDGVDAEFLQNEALSGSELARVGNDLVTVVMPATLHPGEHHRLRFQYAGAVMQQAAPGLLYVGARGTWYPNRGMQMSLFELKFRWPKAWTLVATGRRTSIREEGDAQVGEWNSEVKIPLAGFNLGKFVRARRASGRDRGGKLLGRGGGGIAGEKRLRNWPWKPPARNSAIARRSAEAIEKYEHWFGPYPYKSLALTQMPGPVSQGWPTLVYLSSFAYLSDGERQALNLNEFPALDVRRLYAGPRDGAPVVGRPGRLEELSRPVADGSSRQPECADDSGRQSTRHRRGSCWKITGRNCWKRNPAGKRYADAGPVTLGYRLSSSVFPNAYHSGDLRAGPVAAGDAARLLCGLRKVWKRRRPGWRKAAAFLAALREFGRRYDREHGDHRRLP